MPRSGTTLLRFQLDAHPALAIPPETHFGSVARRLGSGRPAPEEVLDALVALPTWQDLGVTRDELAAAFARLATWTLGEALRTYYRVYAARQGKNRWGDKTPPHCLHMDVLARLLPEARFIHVIRDGRDVAASLRGLPFAPGDGSVDAIAEVWRNHILRARKLARAVPYYTEVRYERLVHEPADVLKELCEFIELPFHAAMLQAHERASERLRELTVVQLPGGGVRRAEERRALHAHTLRPPDASRVGRWRDVLTAEEIARFEQLAGDLLRELRYEPSRR